MGWREEAVVELPWEGDCCNGRVSPFRDTMGGRLWRWGGERGEKERGGRGEGEERGGRERGGRERDGRERGKERWKLDERKR